MDDFHLALICSIIFPTLKFVGTFHSKWLTCHSRPKRTETLALPCTEAGGFEVTCLILFDLHKGPFVSTFKFSYLSNLFLCTEWQPQKLHSRCCWEFYPSVWCWSKTLLKMVHGEMPKGRACCPLPWNFKAFSSAFGWDMAADPSTRTSPLVSCLRRDFQVTWGLCGCGFMNLLWGTVPPAYAERRTRSPLGNLPLNVVLDTVLMAKTLLCWVMARNDFALPGPLSGFLPYRKAYGAPRAEPTLWWVGFWSKHPVKVGLGHLYLPFDPLFLTILHLSYTVTIIIMLKSFI